jgi:hypothetical protein
MQTGPKPPDDGAYDGVMMQASYAGVIPARGTSAPVCVSPRWGPSAREIPWNARETYIAQQWSPDRGRMAKGFMNGQGTGGRDTGPRTGDGGRRNTSTWHESCFLLPSSCFLLPSSFGTFLASFFLWHESCLPDDKTTPSLKARAWVRERAFRVLRSPFLSTHPVKGLHSRAFRSVPRSSGRVSCLGGLTNGSRCGILVPWTLPLPSQTPCRPTVTRSRPCICVAGFWT